MQHDDRLGVGTKLDRVGIRRLQLSVHPSELGAQPWRDEQLVLLAVGGHRRLDPRKLRERLGIAKDLARVRHEALAALRFLALPLGEVFDRGLRQHHRGHEVPLWDIAVLRLEVRQRSSGRIEFAHLDQLPNAQRRHDSARGLEPVGTLGNTGQGIQCLLRTNRLRDRDHPLQLQRPVVGTDRDRLLERPVRIGALALVE